MMKFKNTLIIFLGIIAIIFAGCKEKKATHESGIIAEPQKSETLNISSGDKKIYYAEYDIVTFYGPISEEEYGFIRFQNSHLADESNMDVIFCFVNTKSKVNQANEIYNYIQSQIASINESKLNNVMEQPQMTEKNEAIQVPDQILKYKELFDVGAITEEEFTAKKKQLLGL